MTERERLEEEMARLQGERAEEMMRLVDIETAMAAAALKVVGTRNGSAEQQKAKARKTDLVNRKTAIQQRLGSLKARIAMQAINIDRAKRSEGWVPTVGAGAMVTPVVKPPDSSDRLLELVHGMSEIHDRYAAFAKDPTRINSMRHMAGEVARDIAALLSGKKGGAK